MKSNPIREIVRLTEKAESGKTECLEPLKRLLIKEDLYYPDKFEVTKVISDVNSKDYTNNDRFILYVSCSDGIVKNPFLTRNIIDYGARYYMDKLGCGIGYINGKRKYRNSDFPKIIVGIGREEGVELTDLLVFKKDKLIAAGAGSDYLNSHEFTFLGDNKFTDLMKDYLNKKNIEYADFEVGNGLYQFGLVSHDILYQRKGDKIKFI